jgi:hypothetical protein
MTALIPVRAVVRRGDYSPLAQLAEARGFSTIGEFVSDVLTRIASHVVSDDVALLVQAGLCDADIATELGLLPGTVALRRRRLGLSANRRYPARSNRRAVT